jgi:hypothetical protein
MRRVLLLLVLLSMAVMSLAGCGGALTNLFGLGGTPVRTSIAPTTVTRGSVLTINGQFLNGTLTTAYFVLSGSAAASAIASSGNTTSVQLTVPTGIAPSSANAIYTLYVVTNDGNGDYSSPSNSVSITIQ